MDLVGIELDYTGLRPHQAHAKRKIFAAWEKSDSIESFVQPASEEKPQVTDPPVEEFSVADYYLVRENKLKFKIYPFTKKRGKSTAGVAGCIYEYDGAVNPIVLGSDVAHDSLIISENIKLETVLSFAATMLKINMSDIFQYDKLAEQTGSSIGKTVSLFELLKMMSKLPV